LSTKNDCIPIDTIHRGLGVEWIIASVRAYLHVMGEEDSHSAEFLRRWYIATPSSKEAHVTAWSDHLQKLNFNGVTKGWGKPFLMERCTGCKSTNHPTLDCPFPRDFPELDTTNPAQANPPPEARGKTSRGRGRGRGRGNRGRGNEFRVTTAN
jgi:hypothetical protein